MFNKLVLTKLQAGLIILILALFYFSYQVFSAQFSTLQSKQFTIKRGDNFLVIAQNLKSAGLIKDRLVFSTLVLAKGAVPHLKAGEYVFESGSTLNQIINKIKKGEVVLGSDEMMLGIPEGLNLAQISELIKSEAGKINLNNIKASSLSGKFSGLAVVDRKYNTLEGFVFPDTYRFNKEATDTEILERILKNFDSKTSEFKTRTVLNGRNFYDILKMASILEEEVPPADMPVASGVLWKRLRLGMPLQVDASLVYGLGRPIKRSDTVDFNSPYNTYQYKGLPPTPISNPGLTSIRAAVYPQESDYLYYLSRPRDGATIFSKTLEEHNLAKAKYLNN